MDFTLREATAGDQATIKAIVRGAKLNPMRLDWPNFLVAETNGPDAPKIVGVGQLRPHRDGIRELASIAVDPTHQGNGIGTALVQALMARANGPLYLYCEGHNEPYYLRFGFRPLTNLAEVPRSIRLMPRLVRVIGPVISLILRQPVRLVVMQHPGPQ
jgi:N-acetylglutamate synthase-like GNAT family acetyltransferase